MSNDIQRVREAGGGAPAGATASEGDDSNSAKAATEPAMESTVISASGPEVTSSQGDQIKEPPTLESLQALLRAARYYVWLHQPTSSEDEETKEGLLERIDAAAPPPSYPEFEACNKEFAPGQFCVSRKGHDGDCDDLPF